MFVRRFHSSEAFLFDPKKGFVGPPAKCQALRACNAF